MGRSISARTGATLDALQREERDCRATSGVCRSRATVRILFNDGSAIRGCVRHAAAVGEVLTGDGTHSWTIRPVSPLGY